MGAVWFLLSGHGGDAARMAVDSPAWPGVAAAVIGALVGAYFQNKAAKEARND